MLMTFFLTAIAAITGTVVISKPNELVTPEIVQMTDFLKGFLNVMDFYKFPLNSLRTKRQSQLLLITGRMLRCDFFQNAGL